MRLPPSARTSLLISEDTAAAGAAHPTPEWGGEHVESLCTLAVDEHRTALRRGVIAAERGAGSENHGAVRLDHDGSAPGCAAAGNRRVGEEGVRAIAHEDAAALEGYERQGYREWAPQA